MKSGNVYFNNDKLQTFKLQITTFKVQKLL
jgi:hypothetical protein